jgi:hypothetical protein
MDAKIAKTILSLFNVKLDETFKIVDKLQGDMYEGTFCFKKIGGFIMLVDDRGINKSNLLSLLIEGTIRIQKMRYVPKHEETFWFINVFGVALPATYDKNSVDHLNYVVLGNCYSSEQDAKDHADFWCSVYEQLPRFRLVRSIRLTHRNSDANE